MSARIGTTGGGRGTPLARASYACLALGVLLVAAQAAGLLGSFGHLTFVLLSAVCLVAIAVGVRAHRPTLVWPWRALALVVVLFLVGGAARELLGGLGDLTETRSLVPDAITLSGYALLAAVFVGMTRARYRERTDGVDAVLDAAVAALSILCLAWVHVIVPALALDEAPAAVRLVLAVYPLVSVFLVAIAARLAFGAGACPGVSFFLLLGGMAMLVVGDAGFMLAELGRLHLEPHVLGAPYALVQVATAAAALHPSMRRMTRALPTPEVGPLRGRVLVVAAALGIPGVVTVTHPALDAVDRAVLAGIIAALAVAAVARMLRALQAHARAEVLLADQARRDDLTGLPNRTALSDRLPAMVDRAHRSGRKVGVLFLDIDRFKYVNDSLGHGVGDELLVSVARRVRNAVGDDDVVVRLGGDEFLVALPSVADLDEAVAVAERVRCAFLVPLVAGGSSLVVTASIGAVVSEGPDHAVNDLVRDADAAMYQAKDAGRNAVATFDRWMVDRAARRILLDAELRAAAGGDQLHVAYQPLVVLPEARVEGFEALMRWTHPQLGPIGPDEFIPLAEDSGQIVELGAWILDESCRQIAEWRRSVPGGADLHVSVNVSARQLRDRAFPAVVAEALRRWDLPGDALWLELTESLLLDDPDTTQRTLASLRSLGVQLSLDDFGTGYSSLAYLKRFPVDRVKIDAAFVRGLEASGGSDRSLVAAIVAMAEALGLSTLAEGVETPVQAALLHDLGVGAGQGYLFARPLPAAQVPGTLAQLGTVGDTELSVVPRSA